MFHMNVIREKAEWATGKVPLTSDSREATPSGLGTRWRAIPLQTLHFAFCWGHQADLFPWVGCITEVLGNFLLYLSPKPKPRRDFRCLHNDYSRHAVDWKECIGIVTDSTTTWPEGRGFCEKKGTASACQPAHWQSLEAGRPDASCPAPGLKKGQQGEQARVRTCLFCAQCKGLEGATLPCPVQRLLAVEEKDACTERIFIKK